MSEATTPETGETALARLADEALPSSGLLSFYDRLRDRVEATLSRRAGRLGPAVTDALMLVPDVFILLARLSLDREVPKRERAMIAGALAYFLLPSDLLPELFVGAAGFTDDLVLATAVLAHTLGDLEPVAARHWSGPQSLRQLLTDVTGTARSLLGTNLYGRLTGLLEKQGVKLR